MKDAEEEEVVVAEEADSIVIAVTVAIEVTEVGGAEDSTTEMAL
jgi:hypothetical protein